MQHTPKTAPVMEVPQQLIEAAVIAQQAYQRRKVQTLHSEMNRTRRTLFTLNAQAN